MQDPKITARQTPGPGTYRDYTDVGVIPAYEHVERKIEIDMHLKNPVKRKTD